MIKTKSNELPAILTPASARELWGSDGHKLFNRVANAGGFGSFNVKDHYGLSLDLASLTGEPRAAVQAVFDRAHANTVPKMEN